MIDQVRNQRNLSPKGRLSVSAAGLLLLLGCTDISTGPDQTNTGTTERSTVTDISKMDRNELMEKVLERAIQVGDDLYMIPKGIDEDGCEMFGPYSKANPTATAIYYRQADGSFNATKDLAVCRVDMVALGSDPDGCEMFRARPQNGDLEAVDVTYYRGEDDRYVAHKPPSDCSS